MNPRLPRILAAIHLVLAVLYLAFVALAPWTKRGGENLGAFNSEGGTGFGIIAVVIGVLLVGLALARLAGVRKVALGLGVEQLTVALGAAAVVLIIGFIVGWLAVYEAGTGWGIVAAYFPASFIPQIGLLTTSLAEPEQGIRAMPAGTRRTFSIVALLAGLGVALFPFLEWMSAGSVSLTGFDAATDDLPSGPRLSYVLLIVGAVVAVGAFMRLRPQGLAEPGPNLLLSHCLMAAGLIALLLPLATLISIIRIDGLSAGIGVWLGLLAGLVLVVLALAENRVRGVRGA
jgi:hypothetical protein